MWRDARTSVQLPGRPSHIQTSGALRSTLPGFTRMALAPSERWYRITNLEFTFHQMIFLPINLSRNFLNPDCIPQCLCPDSKRLLPDLNSDSIEDDQVPEGLPQAKDNGSFRITCIITFYSWGGDRNSIQSKPSKLYFDPDRPVFRSVVLRILAFQRKLLPWIGVIRNHSHCFIVGSN